jgi:hypothetical protein
VTLDNNLSVAMKERTILKLSQTIVDFFDGTALDGANTGNPGNPAMLKLNELAGDVDGNGTVNAADKTLFTDAFFKTADGPSPGYTPFADFNGDGVVNILDYAILNANMNASLPALRLAFGNVPIRVPQAIFGSGTRDDSIRTGRIGSEVLS